MKKQKLVIVMLALALFSLAKCSAQDDMHTGFGVSDYNTVLTLNTTEPVWTDIARLYNTGDFNITVTSTWIDENNPSGVQIELTPKTVKLQPDETVLIRARVTGQSEGQFTGEIDFSCDVELPSDYTGNPSVPGGTAHARFIVLATSTTHPPFNWVPIAVVAIALICVLSFVVYRKKTGKPKDYA